MEDGRNGLSTPTRVGICTRRCRRREQLQVQVGDGLSTPRRRRRGIRPSCTRRSQEDQDVVVGDRGELVGELLAQNDGAAVVVPRCNPRTTMRIF